MMRAVKFANRNTEISEFLKFASDNNSEKRVIIFYASKATGVTEFLWHLASNGNKNSIHVYIDMAMAGVAQLADALKEQRDRSLLFRLGNSFQLSFLFQLLSRVAPIASAAFSPLARVGAVALAGLGEGILLEPFPSTSTSRICRIALTWPKPHIFFYLDNAQKKTQEIIQLTRACASDKHYKHVRFVMAITDEADNESSRGDFRRRMPFPPTSVREVLFRPIDPDFVAAIAAARDLNLDRDDCERLSGSSKNNIWKLIDYLDNTYDGGNDQDFDKVSEYILRLLHTAGQPLRRSDLKLLVLKSEQLVATEKEFDNAIDNILEKRLADQNPAEDGDQLVVLMTGSAAPLQKSLENNVENLISARDLYNFFLTAESVNSPRHSKASLVGVLYRLARCIDPAAVPQRAQQLVEVAMAQGSLDDAERYIGIARRQSNVPDIHDLFVQVALYVSLQDYEAAHEVLAKISTDDFDRYRVLRVLSAVTLNRIRSHENSKSRIDSLLAEESTSEEKALLVSYKIAGLLHEEQWDEARDVLGFWIDRLRPAKNYPYFLRNAAAIHIISLDSDLAAAERMLSAALRAFSFSGDAFGEATTRCNLGVVYAHAGEMVAAEKYFRRSYDFLSFLGTQHIQEAGTNLGTALLLLGQLDKARVHITKLLPMMDVDYPGIVTESNLAIIELNLGDCSAALKRMRNILNKVDQVKIRDCSRHARLAAVITESAAGNAERANRILDDLAQIGGAETHVDYLRKTTSIRSIRQHEAINLYRIDWMQYWSQNPLKMLPATALTAQAKLHHMV